MAFVSPFNYGKAVTDADKPSVTEADDLSFFSPVAADTDQTQAQQPEETPMERFLRTGTPQEDPANVPQGDAFFSPADDNEIAPYDWTIAGAPLPTALKPVADIITGLNEGLADVMGVPVTLVDQAMKKVGTDGFLDPSTDGKQAIMKAFESMGIAADSRKAGNKFLAEIGEGAGQNLILLSALFAAAPTMLAAQGEGAVANFTRMMGEALIRNPGTAIAGEFGASAGAEVGENIGQQVSPTGGALGGTIGALTGGTLAGLAGMAATPFTSAARAGYRGAKSLLNIGQGGRELAREATPLIRDSAPVTDLISDAIRGDQTRVDNLIERLTSRLTQNADPVESATALQNVQRSAYRRAAEIRDDYWSKVDLKRPTDTTPTKTFVENLRKNTVAEGQDAWLPNDLMKMVDKLPPRASLERLRAISTLAFERLQSGVMPTAQGVLPIPDRMRGNLKALVSTIQNNIGSAFPNDIELQKATAFSKWMHDRFTRGPVARFAAPRADESQLPNVVQAGNQAANDPRFALQNRDISRVMADEGQAMPALEKAAEQFMRGRLNEEVTRMGPEAAAKWMKKPSTRMFMRAYPKVAAEFQSTSERLGKLIDMRNELNRSTFIKNMNEHPETAINKILSPSNGNSLSQARTLMKRIGNKPEVLEVAKDQLLISLENAGKTPMGIMTILGNNNTRAAVRTILGEDDFRRLNRIAEQAARLTQASTGQSRTLIKKGAKVIGAWLGRKLGTGTLQAPETAGKLSEQLVDQWLGTAENKIFSLAVRDPKWEAILNSRMPQSLSQVRHLKTMMRRAIRIEEAGERAMVPTIDALGEDDDTE